MQTSSGPTTSFPERVVHPRRSSRGLRPAAIVVAAAALACGGCGPGPTASISERTQIGVVRTGDDVRLTGLAGLRGWGEGRDNTFMHCLETVLAALGRPLDYDELMGISGMAFRTQFRVGTWDASNPDPLVGENCVEALLPAIGLEYEVYFPRRNDLADTTRVRTAIVASIDYGVPVLATNLRPPENWGIITGYRYKGQRWWCRTYDPAALRLDQLATDAPSAVVVLTQRNPLPDLKRAHRASIARAVRLYDQALAGDYALGRNAYDVWSAALSRAADRDYLHANAWTYVSLVDARSAAARYLRRIAPEFGGRRADVERAADAYARARQALLKAMQHVPWPRDVPTGVPSYATRERQIAALREAAQIESEAVAALRRAQ